MRRRWRRWRWSRRAPGLWITNSKQARFFGTPAIRVAAPAAGPTGETRRGTMDTITPDDDARVLRVPLVCVCVYIYEYVYRLLLKLLLRLCRYVYIYIHDKIIIQPNTHDIIIQTCVYNNITIRFSKRRRRDTAVTVFYNI